MWGRDWLTRLSEAKILATTSFGLQAAVMLKLLKDHGPRIPIVFIDTGYLFAETYRYAAILEEKIRAQKY